uniref:Putative secreted protein n=1 Tax=Ornithodoros turicata TaxID=34597 RepID=A0A2R5LF14_9ACAR
MSAKTVIFFTILLVMASAASAQFGRPGHGGRRCGNQICPRGTRCVYQRVVCIRAPCPPIPQCVPRRF